jgi:hypothetical protein
MTSFSRAGMLLALAMFVVPSAARAAAVVSVQGSRVVYQASTGDLDNVALGATDLGALRFHAAGATPVTAGQGCAADQSGDVTCPAAAVEFHTLDGGDRVEVDGTSAPSVSEDMGSGDDTVVLYDGSPPSDVHGGDGVDSVLSGPTSAVVFSLNDVADDGQFGDDPSSATGANVHSDVENLRGSLKRDFLTGDAAANAIDGGGGADVIDGGGGPDTITGGDGSDTIRSVDGVHDTVDCGAGNDSVNADTFDATLGCETVYQDADGDGATVPADCNDQDPAIHPGAVDVLDDGVDQNCDGHDATNPDRDADGFDRPADCNDADPGIHPGAAEIRGNTVDENCDGLVAPFLRITSGVRYFFRALASGRTVVKLLAVRDAPVGAAIQVSCRGGGCPARGKRVVARGIKQLPLMGLFKRPLKRGAVIEVRITAPARIGKVVRFTMRAHRPPKPPAVACVDPGAKTPSSCPVGS